MKPVMLIIAKQTNGETNDFEIAEAGTTFKNEKFYFLHRLTPRFSVIASYPTVDEALEFFRFAGWEILERLDV